MIAERRNKQPHLLIIDDEKEMCLSLRQLLHKNNFQVSTAFSAKAGLNILQCSNINLVICDIVMPDMGGLLFLSRIAGKVPVVMITAYASIETARKAFKLGACDYLVKPFEFKELLVVVKQNLHMTKNLELYFIKDRFLQSKNPEYIKMVKLADKFSSTDMPVLITGENGAGKEIIADYVYENSKRILQPYIKINCAAIPETLLESELFGYEKGAFTGASAQKVGKLEEADGGTLFLDEIGDMPLAIQAKLLRVLECFQFTRLGGNQIIRVNTRVITASNHNLEDLIINKEFRPDLYHRLNGVNLSIPPLRDRLEDIEDLAYFFLDQFNEKYDKNINKMDEQVINIFKQYKWPGNIRELKNCLERAVVVCEDQKIMLDHLPDSVGRINKNTPAQHKLSLTEKMKEYSTNYMRSLILDALYKTKGNRTEAAKLLKISSKTLYNKIKELKIKHEFI